MTQNILMLNRKITLQTDIPDVLHVGANVRDIQSNTQFVFDSYTLDTNVNKWDLCKYGTSNKVIANWAVVVPEQATSQSDYPNGVLNNEFIVDVPYYSGECFYFATAFKDTVASEYRLFLSQPITYSSTDKKISIQAALFQDYFGSSKYNLISGTAWYSDAVSQTRISFMINNNYKLYCKDAFFVVLKNQLDYPYKGIFGG